MALPTRRPEKNSEIVIERMKNEIQKYTAEKKRISAWNATAYNMRFCEMAAVTPQTILCEIERLSPAASVVEAATSQSRWDVSGHCGTAQCQFQQ